MKQPKLRAIALALSTLVLAGCQSPEEKVQGFVNSALVQLEQGNVEAAHIEFSNALQINPSTFRACTKSRRCSNSSRNGGR